MTRRMDDDVEGVINAEIIVEIGSLSALGVAQNSRIHELKVFRHDEVLQGKVDVNAGIVGAKTSCNAWNISQDTTTTERNWLNECCEGDGTVSFDEGDAKKVKNSLDAEIS